MYFISYSTKDNKKIAPYLDKIKNRLGKENVWFAPEKIKESEFYAKEILNAIKNSKGIVLFLSKNSITSEHVKREISLAISRGITIYPLRIEDVELNEEWEYLLGTIQWIDIFKDDNLKKFLDNLLNLGIKLNEDEFIDFCICHFKKMGYKVTKNNELLVVKKNNIYFKVLPIYREKLDIKGFKTIEAELFWKYKNLIFKKEILDEFFKTYNFPDDPTFKQKQKFLVEMKNKNKKDNIVFYLYIKNPPIFYKTNFKIGFVNEDKYKEKEILPPIFLNSVYFPAWWGVGRDDLEKIKDERYKNITSTVNEAYKELKNNTNKKMESYNGRLAESFCEVFFRNNGYLVQKFGIENVLGNTLKLVNMHNKELKNTNDLFKYMTLPDFLVMRIDEKNNLEENFLVDVKFRHYYSKKDFYKDLKDGDIKHQAQKYNNFWGNIYLFIIVDFGNEVEIYFDKVENILAGKIKTIKEYNFKNSEIKKLYSYVKTIWENI